MEFEAFVQLIGNVGFPITLSLILLQTILVKFNKQMDALEKRLGQLDKTMNLLVRSYYQSSPPPPQTKEKDH
ncbi:YvrJ family protein [Paenibacillus sp. ISL-20]|uniref:YvrJ family protein n=1 Tax=Paenibacillus sp. ISL-20 TaxID=2819163 RepID=UPI001BE82350|nr:YvrJ family protein [Paenibacillus sp. ISL-20]